MSRKKEIKVSNYNEFLGGYILQFTPDIFNIKRFKPTLTPFEYAVTKELDFFIHLN